MNQWQVNRRINFRGLRVAKKSEPPDDTFGRKVCDALSELNAMDRLTNFTVGDRKLFAVARQHEGFSVLKLGAVRERDLPQIFSGGETVDLDIKPGDGTIDFTHVVFLPSGILGVEGRTSGPSATNLPKYLREVLPDLEPRVIDEGVLVDAGAMQRLQEMQTMHLVDIAITPPAAEALASEDASNQTFWEDIRRTGGVLGGDVIEVTARADRRSKDGRRSFTPEVTAWLRRLARTKEVRARAERFKIVGEGHGRSIEVDFLRSVIIEEATVASLGSNRAVDSNEMFDSIISAYQRRPEEIRAAARALIKADADDDD